MAIAVIFSILAISTDVSAGGKAARIRDIQEFVDAQGTFCLPDGGGGCLLFIPPVENYLGLTSAPQPTTATLFASFDYAGVAERKIVELGGDPLGTTYSGHIRERPLNDGRAEIQVILRTQNALTWVNECCDFATSPVLFGARSTDVIAGAEATLGSCYMKWVFISPAVGDPIPDLMQLLFVPVAGQELLSFHFNGVATGPLSEAFGVADGTPGKLNVTQTGLFMTGFQGAVGDGFPVEHVNLRVLGNTDGNSAGMEVSSPSNWAMSPNPLRVGSRLQFSYNVPSGGAPVSVAIYSVSGRMVASLTNGVQAAGAHSINWNGMAGSGDRVASGVYFVRARIGSELIRDRLVVVE
jgi:hypothetical protein